MNPQQCGVVDVHRISNYFCAPVMKLPLDRTPYPQDPRSVPAGSALPDGCYVYVQDDRGDVFVLPDGPHLHPKVLGHAAAAKYAGDLTIEYGKVIDVTNLSGTFQFDDEDGLLRVAQQLQQVGLAVVPGAIRFFPADGARPVILG